MFYNDVYNDNHNNNVNSVIMQTLAGASLENNPKYRKMAEQIMTPKSTDISQFNNWYNKQGFSHPYNPSESDYNMYGFWKALSTNPNSVGTEINPNDNRIHFSDTVLNPNGTYTRLKMPWHNNAWTTSAWDMLQTGDINQKDIEKLNEWNRQRLSDKYQEYQTQGGW